MASLKDAIQWIADNDSAGDDESPNELAKLVTVCLVADIFDKEPLFIAHKVYKVHHPEANTKPTLIASSGTFPGIIGLIVKFYHGSFIKLESLPNEVWNVHNSHGKIDSVRVVIKGNRYRFERV